jgi:WD40 repeat protein
MSRFPISFPARRFRVAVVTLCLSLATVAGQDAAAQLVRPKTTVRPNASSQPRLMVQVGYSNGVTSVTFSPDGRLMLASSLDHSARIWDVASGREIRDFRDPKEAVGLAAFSSDGRLVLTASDINDAQRIWDAASGKEIWHFERGVSSDGRLEILNQLESSVIVRDSATAKVLYRFDVPHSDRSPDGRLVLSRESIPTDSGQYEHFVSVKDSRSGKELHRLQGHSGSIRAMTFSPDGHWIFTSSDDKTARLWDTATGKELRRFTGDVARITQAAFSPDGRLLLGGGDDKAARLWDTATGKLRWCYCEQPGRVESVAFSQDGQTILTSGGDWARLWRRASHKPMQQFEGNTSTDHRMFLQANVERRFWIVRDPKTLKELHRFGPFDAKEIFPGRGRAEHQTFSPDGRLQAETEAKEVIVRDAATGKELRRCSGHQEDIHALAFSPDSRFLLTGSGYESYLDNTVRLWDVDTCKLLRILGAETTLPSRVSFTGDGRSLAVEAGFFDSSVGLAGAVALGGVYLWDLTTGQQKPNLKMTSSPRGLASFSRDGKRLLTGARGKSFLFDTMNGQQLSPFEGFPGAVSPSGDRVVTVGKDLKITLWNASGEKIRELSGGPTLPANQDPDESPSSFIKVLSFTPDGEAVAAGTTRGGIFLWNVTTGEPVCEFHRGKNSGSIESMFFSQDGKSLVTRATDDPDTSARLWDVKTCKQVRRFAMDDDNDYRYNVTDVALSTDGRLGLTWGYSSGIDQVVSEGADTPRL